MAEELRLLKEASQAHIELQQRQFTELMHSRAHLCGTCRADLTAAEKTATAKKSANNENANENETSSIKDSAVERKEWAEEDWMHNLCAAVWLMATLDAATVSTEAELCDAASLLQTAKQCITQSSITATTPTEASTTVEKQPQTADLAAACELLVMYINNILKNPSVPRYRRVSTTNSSYMKSLLPVEAQAVRVLHAVGFVKKAESTYYEYSWHSLPAAASGSSVDKVSAGKEGAAGSTIDRVPGSAEVATKLLHSAVSLLTALKTRKTALAEVLVQRLTASSASTTGVEGDSGSTSGSQQVDSAGEKVAVLVGGAANVHTTINSKASVTAGPGAISGAGEDGLIAVMEVGEEGVGLLSGNSALDDGVDFMKVLYVLNK